MKTIKLVEEFHKTFKQPNGLIPNIPNKNIMSLRLRLLKEEIDELITAVNQGDIVECADALGDIQYLLDGTFIVFGLDKYKDRILKEIHDSNMSKTCNTIEEAHEAIDDSTGSCGPMLYYDEVGSKFVLYRMSDGKVLKGPHYRKPDLTFVKYE